MTKVLYELTLIEWGTFDMAESIVQGEKIGPYKKLFPRKYDLQDKNEIKIS